MVSISAIHNPLKINLLRQTTQLRSSIPKSSTYHKALNDVSSTRQLLVLLSALLADPTCTLLVATLFRPVLMDLCARWLETHENEEENLVALCYLVEVHEELFPILYRLLLKDYKNGPLSFLDASPSPLAFPTFRLHRVLLAYYRLLQINREIPRLHSWSLTYLSNLIWTPGLDNGVRFLAIRCYSLQSGMGEAERLKLERQVIGDVGGVDCQIHYHPSEDGTEKEVDGWILPITEVRRIQDMRSEIATNPANFFSGVDDEMESPLVIHSSDLSPLIVNVHGILLLRSSSSSQIETSHIPTPTSIAALQQLASHISLRIPTLISSPPSGGKSLLISHLATLLYPDEKNHAITIHLADTSLDPRGLLGSYVSSTTRPGNFDWKEGVLVRSMREGKWIVLEDIDRASNEILGVIKPLIESLSLGKWIGGRASITVPGRGQVVAHDRFMIFATRSLFPSKDEAFSTPTFFGAHKFYEVTIPTLSIGEIRTIIDTKFPHLAGGTAKAVIQMWDSARKARSPSSPGEFGLRELEKYCRRITRLCSPSSSMMEIVSEDEDRVALLRDIFTNPSIREDMFLEARDIFIGAGTLTISTRLHAETVASILGEHLGLDHERRKWVLERKLPEFELEKDVNGQHVAVRVGRICLLANSRKIVANASMRPFAMHRSAVSLISRIATAVSLNEPILLTGETGTGKTSIVTHLAALLRHTLISLNLSQQTESSDLIGGLKPIDPRIPASSLQETFITLFSATFSRKKNEKFEKEVRKAVNESKWKRVVGLWKESTRLAMEKFQARQDDEEGTAQFRDVAEETPRKRRKRDHAESRSSALEWSSFLHQVEEFEIQHVHGSGRFAFGFVEGPLIKALRSGDWVLLDEVNLASPETLECISSLLDSPTASITLTEHGSLEPIPRHPNFRLFTCMNPATDVGKKDLPGNIRSRFTEIDVPSPDADKETLLAIINQYIGHFGDKAFMMDVADLYSAIKQLSQSGEIADGANHRPHFSMRTLTRALTFAADTASAYSLRRSVWEGCLMAFTMALDSQSALVVTTLAQKHLLSQTRNVQAWTAREPPMPERGEFHKQGPFYLEKGSLEEGLDETYILTPSVHQKLTNLARIVLTGRFPVLIEGPTSSGKTSAIEYLAKKTRHRFVRINNHDHTDIQEYLGSYISDPLSGKLVFKDGLLVQALRNGYWIVLDELNLAPTDVLEALNRLLDDNRELFIPETQEIIHPHPHFRLFATQNPPGLYAGRKILSRAFRNRFLEVHFEDVPQEELETILCQRCRIAPSYGKKIVNVFHELQKRRQTARVFESKNSFATLRDLFRWAGRDAVGYQELAENGYMLLAERTRRPEDKVMVKEVIETIMNVRIDEEAIYDIQQMSGTLESFLGCKVPESSNVCWTKAMQRLYVLVCRALRFNEPVLLVGETGSGKTSVCQTYADATGQQLLALSCHQNIETADLIGGIRPVRNRAAVQAELVKDASLIFLQDASLKHVAITSENIVMILKTTLRDHPQLPTQLRTRLESIQRQLQQQQSIFNWHDGPLVEAMQNGNVFLLDEISLADDSVLERLNSVLEQGRSITLAERSGSDTEDSFILATEAFKLIATMNPGGDYGKKELSPALRNRFTEIWVPAVDDLDDLRLIVDNTWRHDSLKSFTLSILEFVDWLCKRVGDRSLMGLRDILAWVLFMNTVYAPQENDLNHKNEIFHHAAHMTYLDGLGSFPQLSSHPQTLIQQIKLDSLQKLQEIAPFLESTNAITLNFNTESHFQLGAFAISRGDCALANQTFDFSAPTPLGNAIRVIRACQVPKPILLEGSPGVGKTSLITALANMSGHHLCRINLSDQTDLIDLFGSDLPTEGGAIGDFAWRDAEFLKALQEGHWVLLDEMNLAPQAVLEGLNAVLDHRGAVYIPELNRTFRRHPSFRIFAAQNPINQGGGRKGLPRSFVNRFTKVYMEELTEGDFLTVCRSVFPDIEESTLNSMISFNLELNQKVTVHRAFAREGSPWEFNLRDILRWGTLMTTPFSPRGASAFLSSIYLSRFRTPQDRKSARLVFEGIFSVSTAALEDAPPWTISDSVVQFGHFNFPRQNVATLSRPRRILKSHLTSFEVLGACISQSWLAILTGACNTGKTDIVRAFAHVTGKVLHEVCINSGTDALDFLGTFEQVDPRRRVNFILNEFNLTLESELRLATESRLVSEAQDRFLSLERSFTVNSSQTSRDILEGLCALAGSLSVSSSHLAPKYQAIQQKLQGLLDQPVGGGRFEWVDGPLVEAIKSGHWLLMDGANLCNPSVLDRLNSLCESDGRLTLSERGFVNGEVQTLKPHANFRLFMTVDPQYGELSRAMRNRGIEIALLGNIIAEDANVLLDHYRLPQVSKPSRNFHHQALGFEAARRGTSDVTWSPSHENCSLGRLLDQDSALSTILEQSPALLPQAVSERELFPHIFVASRALVPMYMPYVRREFRPRKKGPELSSLLSNFLSIFPSLNIDGILVGFRQEYASRRALVFDSILSLPMDIYCCALDGVENILSTTLTASHARVLEILNVNAALFIHDHCVRNLPGHNYPATSLESQAFQAAMDILFSVSHIGHTILNVATEAQMTSLKLVLTGLTLGRHLTKALEWPSFNFSVIQSISQCFGEALEDAPPQFKWLCDCVQALQRLVSLSSGLGLLEVWSAFYLELKTEGLGEHIQHTEALACSLQDDVTSSALRRQAFDIVSLETLPSVLTSKYSASLATASDTLRQCLVAGVEEPLRETTYIDCQSLLLELNILMLHGNNDRSEVVAKKSFKLPNLTTRQVAPDLFLQLIAMTSQNNQAPFLRLIPYQHLAWSWELGSYQLSILVRTHISWLEGLWKTRCMNDGVSGPAILFHPVQLHTTTTACDLGQVNVSALLKQETKIQQQGRLTITQSEHQVGRLEQMFQLFYQTATIVVSCFSTTFNEHTGEVLRGTSKFVEGGWQSFFSNWVNLVEESDHKGLASAVQKFIRPLLSLNVEGDDLRGLGSYWVALSQLIFDLIIPSNPIDPAVIQQYNFDRLSYDEQATSLEIELHSQLERLHTGNFDNAITRYLSERSQEVRKSHGSIPRLPNRNDPTRLHLFWSEVSQFQANVLHPDRVNGLLNSLGAGLPDGSAREQVIQDSLASFCQRLERAYPDFVDINVVIKLAIFSMRLGLRLNSRPPTRTVNDPSMQLLPSLLVFPSVKSSQIILEGLSNIGPSGYTAFRHILLTISAFAFERSIGVEVQIRLPALTTAFEQATRLWLIDREKEKQTQEDSRSLYRTSKITHTMTTDAELEEQEFLALFPTFEESLNATVILEGDEQPPRSSLVSGEDMNTLLRVYFEIYGRQNAIKPTFPMRPIFHVIRNDSIKALLSSSASSQSQHLDTESVLFQQSLLHETSLSIRPQNPSNELPFNFYCDPNFTQLRRAAAVIDSLSRRLQVILMEWPDQMVVKHLHERCDIILALKSGTPIAKALTLIEQLLVKTEDWEMYANRDNSLKEHREALINLIVDWRRLELSCWQRLLDSEIRVFQEGVSEWWFRLYDVLIRGTLSVVGQHDEEHVTGYLQTMVPLLDEFITTSPLGQFEARMQLLQSFQGFLSSTDLHRQPLQQGALKRVSCILSTTFQSYDLYSTAVSKYFLDQKSILEKEIKGFIKLASWKDINVQALKQSAQRTHHHLFKIVRKFRDVLRQPVALHIQPHTTPDLDQQHFKMQSFPELPSVMYIGKIPQTLSTSANHLLHLERTLTKFQTFTSKKILPAIRASSAQTIEDLATEIIMGIKELASTVIPANQSLEKREKQLKALLVRKRKAWSDLLKELKASGLATNVKPDILRKNMDQAWIREQSIMPVINGPNTVINKGEKYFLKLCALLPILRTSITSHHSDLTTRELHRAQMLLESGFSMALNLRSRLAPALYSCQRLRHILQRLHTLSSSDNIMMGLNLHEHVTRLKDLLCKVSYSLEETHEHTIVIKSLKSNSPTDVFVEDLSVIRVTTHKLRDRLVQLLDDLRNSPLPLLTKEENSVLESANLHLRNLPVVVQKWCQQYPRLQYLLLRLQRWFNDEHQIPLSSPETVQASSPVEPVINSLLVTIQEMVSRIPTNPETAVEESSDQYILKGHHSICEFTRLLNLDIVNARLAEFLHELSRETSFNIAINQVLPFLDIYLSLAENQLVAHSNWTTSFFKLNFTLCSVIRTLAEQGFCKPPDSGVGEDDGANVPDAAGGVGIGEGSGEGNVSKEIEDESQVEGLQGDGAEEQNPKPDQGDDDAIEMSDDFGGALEDVPKTESDEDAASEIGDEEGPEEALEHLDNFDPSAVDEKLWGDEKGPNDDADSQDDKTQQDHSTKQGPSEVTAKESRVEKESGRQREENPEQTDETDADDMEGEQEGNDDTSEPHTNGAPMDEFVQEANTLDLPDDLNLEEDIKGEEHLGDDNDSLGMEEDNEGEDGGVEPVADFSMDESEVDGPGGSEGERDKGKEVDELKVTGDDDDRKEEKSENAVAQPEVSQGDGVADPNEVNDKSSGESTSFTDAGASQVGSGQDTAIDEKHVDKDGDSKQHQISESQEPKNDQSGSADAGAQQGQAASQCEENPTPNPLRSLGDTLKEIRQRFNDILSSDRKEARQGSESHGGEQTQLEYLQPEDDDHDMQALGPAGEEQVANLDHLKLIDDTSTTEAPTAMDIDLPLPEEIHEMRKDQHPQQDQSASEVRNDMAGAFIQTAAHSEMSDPFTGYQKTELINEDDTVELQLREWRAADYPDGGAEQIWRLYESLTHDLAYTLCEQLRLILEPTLATRLKGDYRTGKRLNMKKVIPYIASDYAKDKIWLRRTKPSQREYQVLISIDDSRSMAESHCIHLAYQTLALISKALNRLESGDVAIAKFGEGVELLHGFGIGAFTDRSGAQVINAFRFNQKATNVLSLLETSLRVLGDARERRAMSSVCASDLWQLQFIVSDGMCQDHDKLRTVLRKAQEQRVMIVFIILDSLQSATAVPGEGIHSSILSMDKAEFKNVNGKMDLQLQKYLDSFPFEYYVVLRNVESLPDVLAGTLKQFFERISEE